MSNLIMGILTAAILTAVPAHATGEWPLWNSYTTRFLNSHGRILDHDSNGRTTSEGQAYALFFALVSNDQKRFDQLLQWTAENLANGDLSRNLPAWEWGEAAPGTWTVRDRNSASDADLWIAYTLLEAGDCWTDSRYANLGRQLADLIAQREVARVPGLGAVLLPGLTGFQADHATFYLNASYWPPQILLGLATHCPEGPWHEILANLPKLIKGSAPHGFALDWVAYRSGKGFLPVAPSGKRTIASYDAIRVYLWAGMLDAAAPLSRTLRAALYGMPRALERDDMPPAIVSVEGTVEDRQGGPGFSAALVPYLESCQKTRLAARQRQRVRAAWNAATGLYGDGKYYDQNLILFASGWWEGRYRFACDGGLKLPWRDAK